MNRDFQNRLKAPPLTQNRVYRMQTRRRCGARTRSGKTCGKWANRGMLRCFMHGGHPRIGKYLDESARPKSLAKAHAVLAALRAERKAINRNTRPGGLARTEQARR